MKKLILGFAALSLLALSVVSCNKDVVETKIETDNYLSFSTSAGKTGITRASEMTIEDLREEVLEVRTYRQGDLDSSSGYYDLEEYETFYLTYGWDAPYTSGWGYGETPVIHPEFDLVHFSYFNKNEGMNGNYIYFDYAGPYEEYPRLEFTCGDNEGDLLVAKTKSTFAEPEAKLVYKHALSQINFAVKGHVNVSIAVKDISLGNVADNGYYWYNTHSWESVYGSHKYDYSLTGGAAEASTDGLSNSILYLGNTGNNPAAGITPKNDNDNALMLIPQPLDGVSLTFAYKLTQHNGLDLMDNPDADGFKRITLEDISTLGIEEWEIGKRYLYIININLENLTFDVELVEDWIDGEFVYTPDVPELPTPSNVTITNLNSNGFTVTWDAVEGDFEGDVFRYSISPTGGTRWESVAQGDTHKDFTFADLEYFYEEMNGVYSIVVRAQGNGNTSANSKNSTPIEVVKPAMEPLTTIADIDWTIEGATPIYKATVRTMSPARDWGTIGGAGESTPITDNFDLKTLTSLLEAEYPDADFNVTFSILSQAKPTRTAVWNGTGYDYFYMWDSRYWAQYGEDPSKEVKLNNGVITLGTKTYDSGPALSSDRLVIEIVITGDVVESGSLTEYICLYIP